MSNIISIDYLFQFLIFIYIIPGYIIAQSKLQIAFANGLNVIRCSDEQVQVYFSKDGSGVFLSNILKCDNKNNILDNAYTKFIWSEMKIICSPDNIEVHEELIIEKTPGLVMIDQLPDAEGQLCHSTDAYELDIIPDSSQNFDTISSKDQPANDAYFNEKTGSKERRIYISFPDHPIICRVIFTSNDDNPCPSMHDQNVADVKYACYYNPSDDAVPTMGEMEAELKQVEEATKPDNTDAYVLDLAKPNVIPSDPCNSQPDQPNQPHQPQPHHPQPNQPQPHHPQPHQPQPQQQNIPSGGSSNKGTGNPSAKHTKSKKSASVLKIVGLILGILLIIALIGGIGFYMIRQHRLNSSPSSSSSIEDGGNKGLSSRAANQSEQSLATTTTRGNDANTELSMNNLPKKEKPTIELQTSKGNKKQRTGTSMVLNEDM